ncbi:UNC93-like protein 3 [Impatiens glandulifera]|uniref:UNC93-like protein 3 n=1 Tax=Impatiens glandulifera TaxID=253017 RepID=UPI001FB1853B|nr:UNC93-like protein 3 [Impatiens glandulifera]
MDEEVALILRNSESQTETQNHTRDIHILSSAFLLIFLAYGAAQNLESTVNTGQDLGTISLGILYTSFAASSLFASLVVKGLGSKNALVLGTTGYWLFIAANLKPTWLTMVPASLYLGFTASVIWVAQGTYLTSSARFHANDCKLEEPNVIGSLNGEFWGVFATHQILGNLLSLALLNDGVEGETSNTTLLFLVFLCSMTIGTVLMCFLSKKGSRGEIVIPDSSDNFYSFLISKSKSLFTPLFDKRMLLLIPLIAYSGLQQAFVWAEFTKFIVKPTLGESGVGGAMAVYGAFNSLCSLFVGRLTSGLQSITWIVAAGASLQSIALITVLFPFSVTSGVMYPLIVAAILGIGDGVFNTQLNALLAMLFKHDMEGAFSHFKLWQSGAIAVVFFLSPYISMQTMVVIMLVSICISMFGFFILVLKVEAAFSTVA